jgi:hypothetical protein
MAHAAPTNKVTAATAAGALSILLVYVLGEVGVEISTEAASAITTLLAFVAGYLTPGSTGRHAAPPD